MVLECSSSGMAFPVSRIGNKDSGYLMKKWVICILTLGKVPAADCILPPFFFKYSLHPLPGPQHCLQVSRKIISCQQQRVPAGFSLPKPACRGCLTASPGPWLLRGETSVGLPSALGTPSTVAGTAPLFQAGLWHEVSCEAERRMRVK